jgi:hypothetical protein
MPLSEADSAPDNATYLEGIHCKHCVASLTDKKRASLEERNRQIKLAADKNTTHLGLQLSDIKATRSLKRKKLHRYDCGSLIVVTRVHCKSATSLVKIENIVDFAKNCVVFADKVLILLGITASPQHSACHKQLLEALASDSESSELMSKVLVELVTPWVGFTTPLNVGVRLAMDAGYDHVLFQVSQRCSTVYIYIRH